MERPIERATKSGIQSFLRGAKSVFVKLAWPARLAVAAVAAAGLLLVGLLLFSYGSTLCQQWVQARLLARANAMLQEGRFGEASQIGREIWARHPGSLPALYVLADAAEKQNREEAVAWRGEIARRLPKNPDSQLNLASAALRFGKLDVARQALERVAPSDRDSAAFHVVAGWLAHAQGNLAEQEEQFAAAVRKEPQNDLYQFNLAALQIHSSDATKSAQARATLERLSKVAPHRAGALRALLNDAVARNHFADAANFAQQLQMSPEVTFNDYLLCLNLYRKLDSKEFRLLLERVKRFAARNSSELAALINWMNQNQLASDAVKWIENLSARQLDPPPVAVAVADAYANAREWSALKRWTKKPDWGDAEYLRLAYRAIAIFRSSGSSGDDSEFDTIWQAAERATGAEAERQRDLARLASKWRLQKQSEQSWLRVAQNPAMRREALDALRLLYRRQGDLENLYGALQQLHECSPDEAPIAADLARLGLHLGKDPTQMFELAKAAYDRAPNDANCALTYAFVLDRLGRNEEALNILKTLAADQLFDPHAAVYAAVISLDASQADAARDFLVATDEEKVFEEEKELLREARTKLSSVLAAPAPLVSSSPAGPRPSPAASPR